MGVWTFLGSQARMVYEEVSLEGSPHEDGWGWDVGSGPFYLGAPMTTGVEF